MPKHHAVKTQGMEVKLHTFLTLAQDEDEWSASCCGCFAPSTYWIVGLMDPGSSLNVMMKRKFFASARDQTLSV
jgi:hypothetical protein